MTEGVTMIHIRKIDPFIELALRLHDNKENEDLILLRNQNHAETPTKAALRYANNLIMFLR